ncbi:hypothetical protein [Hirschia baltica]|uniref:Uncharacterized protein n=1 Tax=Hirschia baltica (strain ATCC 49814 / DSM 5838 / IFAM 1418) TaxID=582402 RepID=C6XNS1_HIRBI|nr:hypothetical protein [Hirschia baltica]ACT58324.1 conserved hypothetical protein [Hirschia baltica ATCC 49814]
MGGLGSGNNNRWANKTDELHKLDLATFKKGWFARYRSGAVTWTRGDQKTGSINYHLSPSSMRLSYAYGSGDNKQTIDERFELAFTPQHFGNERMWIVCKSCQRRCRVLYGAKLFRCRKCYELTYPSQYEFIRIPNLSTAETLKDKLGGEAGFVYPFPNKPKGMHWKTYQRYERVYYEAEKRMNLALMSRMHKYS